MTFTDAKKAEWLETLKDPEHDAVRAIAEAYPPWQHYLLEETDQVVLVTSYYEDGTLKVYIDPERNNPNDFRTGFEVFGVKPSSLTPLDTAPPTA